jgi:hypothetical protein
MKKEKTNTSVGKEKINMSVGKEKTNTSVGKEKINMSDFYRFLIAISTAGDLLESFIEDLIESECKVMNDVIDKKFSCLHDQCIAAYVSNYKKQKIECDKILKKKNSLIKRNSEETRKNYTNFLLIVKAFEKSFIAGNFPGYDSGKELLKKYVQNIKII